MGDSLEKVQQYMFVWSDTRARVKDPGDDSILRAFEHNMKQSNEFKETLRQFQELSRDHPNYNVDFLEGKIRIWIDRQLQDKMRKEQIADLDARTRPTKQVAPGVGDKGKGDKGKGKGWREGGGKGYCLREVSGQSEADPRDAR